MRYVRDALAVADTATLRRFAETARANLSRVTAIKEAIAEELRRRETSASASVH